MSRHLVSVNSRYQQGRETARYLFDTEQHPMWARINGSDDSFRHAFTLTWDELNKSSVAS